MHPLAHGIVDRVAVVPASDFYPKPGLIWSRQRLAVMELALCGIPEIEVLRTDLALDYWPRLSETADRAARHVGIPVEHFTWLLGADKVAWHLERDDRFERAMRAVQIYGSSAALAGLSLAECESFFSTQVRFLTLPEGVRSSSLRDDSRTAAVLARLGITWEFAISTQRPTDAAPELRAVALQRYVGVSTPKR